MNHSSPRVYTEIGFQVTVEPDEKASNEEPQKVVQRLWGRFGILTPQGRDGIRLLCRHLQLEPEDDITIFSTRSNQYVSSHVTCPLFDYARPSKVLTDRTKLLYVIHLFGEPYEELDKVFEIARERNLPVMEDCAHTIFFPGDNITIGKRADYVLFSLPKVFAMPTGGVLLGDIRQPRDLPPELTSRLPGLAEECALVKNYRTRRQEIFQRFSNAISGSNMTPLFKVEGSLWPFAFPFTVPDERRALDSLRKLLSDVEVCSWNDRGIITVPVHQKLSGEDIDRISQSLKELGNFLK